MFNCSGESEKFGVVLAALKELERKVEVGSTQALRAAVLRRAVRATRLPPEAATVLRVRCGHPDFQEPVGARYGCRTGRHNGLGERRGLKYRLVVLARGVQMHFQSSGRSAVRGNPTYSGSARARPWLTERCQGLQPNPSLERTHTGMPLQAVISFSALRVLPVRAAQLKR